MTRERVAICARRAIGVAAPSFVVARIGADADAGSHDAGRGARDATLPHAGAPVGICRGRAVRTANVSKIDTLAFQFVGLSSATTFAVVFTAVVVSTLGRGSADTIAGLAANATTANNFVAFFFIRLAPSLLKTTSATIR